MLFELGSDTGEKLHAGREIQVFKQDERGDEHDIGNNKRARYQHCTHTNTGRLK